MAYPQSVKTRALPTKSVFTLTDITTSMDKIPGWEECPSCGRVFEINVSYKIKEIRIWKK